MLQRGLGGVNGAALLRSIGATQGSKGQASAQMKSYQEAHDILELIGKLETHEAAVLFDHMGDAHQHVNDIDGALTYFKRSPIFALRRKYGKRIRRCFGHLLGHLYGIFWLMNSRKAS